jgi:hypothetical protein
MALFGEEAKGVEELPGARARAVYHAKLPPEELGVSGDSPV